MDNTTNLTLDLKSILRMTLFGEKPRLGLSTKDFSGPMGDFSEPKIDLDISKIAETITIPDHLKNLKSRYRPCWEMGSDNSRDDDDYAQELVDRVILSATTNDGDDDDFGLARPFDYSGRKPVNYMNLPKQKHVQVENLLTEKHRKSPNKLDRKIRRVRNGQDSLEEVIYMAEELPPGCLQPPPNMPPGPTICLPLLAYRRMIGSELIAEGRLMLEYYAAILHKVRQEKDGALRQQIFWQDRALKAEQDAAYYEIEAINLRTIAGNMSEEIQSLREAKRRRRNAKKSRNRLSSNQSASCIDMAEGDDEADDDVSGGVSRRRGTNNSPNNGSNKMSGLSHGEHMCDNITHFLSRRIVEQAINSHIIEEL